MSIRAHGFLTMDADTLRTVAAVARENRITLVSAGLAFYMFNALLPLLVFLVIGVTAFGWVEQVLATFDPVFGVDPDAVLSAMEEVIGDGAGRRRAAVIAAGILAWSSFTMFQSVNMTFGHIYGQRTERSTVGVLTDTILILLTVLLAVALMVVVHAGLTIAVGATLATLASLPLLALGLFAIFVPMFYQFSPPDVTVREVLPGAVLGAISWTACAVGFRIYFAISESVELYGIAGGVMLLLTWLYVSALALLLGIVLNAVLADRVNQ